MMGCLLPETNLFTPRPALPTCTEHNRRRWSLPLRSAILRSLRMRKREKVIPIILAAGGSHALPFPKALAPFGRKTALEIAVENCSFLGRSLVVLGSDAKGLLPAVPKSAEVVINRRWREGQLSSLQAALRSID